jgi:fermentation-respiration switch protein FrsA (DUF1100 family)
MFTALALSLAALAALLAAGVWYFQGKLVWFPGPPPSSTPERAGLEYQDVWLTTSDGVDLAAWWIPVPQARGAVIVCHGNAGSIENRLHLAAALVEMGWSVLLFDYRGYGASAGSPSEEGTYRDATAALEWVVREQRGLPIVFYGESLGGAVAAHAAAHGYRSGEVTALVLDSAFTSLPDIAADVYPWLPRFLARIEYATITCVSEIARPVIVLHSRDDEIVPFEHAERLVAAARGEATLIETGGGHNDGGFTQRAEWRAELAAALDAAIE